MADNFSRDPVLKYLMVAVQVEDIAGIAEGAVDLEEVLRLLEGRRHDALMPSALKGLLSNSSSAALLRSLVFARISRLRKLGTLENEIFASPCLPCLGTEYCTPPPKILFANASAGSAPAVGLAHSAVAPFVTPVRKAPLEKKLSLSCFDPLKCANGGESKTKSENVSTCKVNSNSKASSRKWATDKLEKENDSPKSDLIFFSPVARDRKQMARSKSLLRQLMSSEQIL